MSTTEKPKYHDEAWLREKYIDEGLSQSEIGDLCGVTQGTVGKWIQKFDIPTGHSPDSKQYQDESWLREQYCANSKSQREIANECGVTQGTIYLWMGKHEIETREMDEAVATGDLDLLKNEDWLRSKYHKEGLSALEIGEATGFDSSTVCDFMNRHGIERREMSKACSDGDVEKLWDRDWLYEQYVEQDKTQQQIAEGLDVSLYTVQQWLKRHNIPIPDAGSWRRVDDEKLNDKKWLVEQYNKQGRTAIEIAEERDVSKRTVYARMEQFGIERRELRGEQSPHWKGGEREYGAGWSRRKRRNVRVRDQARCQSCGMTESTHIQQFDTKLHVHHIKPARQFENPSERNAMSNLITLCASCHHGLWEPMTPLRPDTRTTAD